jgi:DNA-binding response OmpR family regulator
MRILIAEDEKALSDVLVKILKRNNYSIDAVYNGEDAVDFLDAENYDCAILDVMMPKKDGFEVLKTIREKGNDIPVLMLTAKTEIEDKVKGLDYGADDYLTKPFVAKELVARIRAITRRQKVMTDNVITLGNITLNRNNFELKSSSGSYALANKEFQMLETLLTANKQVVTPDILLDKIWGYDSDAGISIVWVYISYLRKKLTALNANVSIKAKRNVGYYVVVDE